MTRSCCLLNRWFCQWLEEMSTDFRVGAESLAKLAFAVFGCGNSLYIEHFNTVSICSYTSMLAFHSYCHAGPLAVTPVKIAEAAAALYASCTISLFCCCLYSQL